MSTQRKMTSASLQKIMSKRITVPVTGVGKRARFTVQGSGTDIPVKTKDGVHVMSSIPGEEGVLLYKRIFNVQANSAIALSNVRNRKYLADGLAAEKAGELDKADELFTAFLNATQISFSMILPSAVVDKLDSNVEITARVEKISTDAGELLTLENNSIAVAPVEEYSSTAFDLNAFLPAEPVDGTEVKTAAEVLAEGKA